MKNKIAFLTAGVIGLGTIILAVFNIIPESLTVILLIFSLFSGFIIANYDLIKKFKWKDFEIESFEREVGEVKNDALNEIKTELATQKEEVGNLSKHAEKTKGEIANLFKSSSDLALLITKVSWLQLQTKNEFGTERAQRAIKNINEDLNEIIKVVIPDEENRNKWINKLQNSLPPRK